MLNRFGVEPKAEMDKWLDMVRRGVVGTLIIGGVFGVDKWRLVSCNQIQIYRKTKLPVEGNSAFWCRKQNF
mgnify:CR=1 FL=1